VRRCVWSNNLVYEEALAHLGLSRQKQAKYINILAIVQGVSKRALQVWKLIEIYTEDIHNVLNFQNVAKYTEFYLG
jgi:hypothetical protein